MWEPAEELHKLVGVLALRLLETERPHRRNKLGEATIEDRQNLVQDHPPDRQRVNSLESLELLQLENLLGFSEAEIEVQLSYVTVT